MKEWMRVCTLEEIPRLGSRVVQTGMGNIAVFRNALDEIFALLDQCPHKGGPLSQGLVFDRRVTCPLHGWTLQLDCGEELYPTAAAHSATGHAWTRERCISIFLDAVSADEN